MTKSTVVHTDLSDTREAGIYLGGRIASAFHPRGPDAVILFASPRYDPHVLLQALHESCSPPVLVGCSTAGEFTSSIQGEGLICAVALQSHDILFYGAVGTGLHSGRAEAVHQLVGHFQGERFPDYPYRTGLILTDSLAGHTEDLLEKLTLRTAGAYQFFGGGAGDNGRFASTKVFIGRKALSGAVVALEMLSKRPLGIGVQHGWRPDSPRLRVTEATGFRVISLNAMPVAEVFAEYAQANGLTFDPGDPLPFFLHHTLGVDTGLGYKIRVPLGVNPDGSITCATEVPAGAVVHIMATSSASAAEAAGRAAKQALRQLNGNRPSVALFFDCVATRFRLGREFGSELAAIQSKLGQIHYAGCNTHGQVARAEGQFNGFHNCTAVVCAIPE